MQKASTLSQPQLQWIARCKKGNLSLQRIFAERREEKRKALAARNAYRRAIGLPEIF